MLIKKELPVPTFEKEDGRETSLLKDKFRRNNDMTMTQIDCTYKEMIQNHYGYKGNRRCIMNK